MSGLTGRRILLGMLVGAAVIAGVWWGVTYLAIASTSGRTAEVAKSVNDARASGFQLLGASVLAVGLFFTARTLALSQHSQSNSSFTSAIEHLGNQESQSVRLGGIQSLWFLVVREAEYWPAIDGILSAFIRERAIRPDGVDADVQAALNVLGRRKPRPRVKEPRLDLHGVWLRGAVLAGANLEGVRFDGAHLDGATLTDAKLGFASMVECSLRGARLSAADLAHVIAWGADFTGSDFYRTVTQGLNVDNATLDDLRSINEAQRRAMVGNPVSEAEAAG